VIRVPSWERLFGPDAAAEIRSILPAFLQARRWFRAKARTIREVGIEDAIEVPGTGTHILVIRVDYTDGEGDHYVLPLMAVKSDDVPHLIGEPDEVVAKVKAEDGSEGMLYGGLAFRELRDALLDSITCARVFEGRNGQLAASHTGALERDCGDGKPIDSFVSRAEQSNTSIIFGDHYILKLFRKLEKGLNPDLEIGVFLTENGFRHTPAVLGTIEYRTRQDGDVYAAAILQQFVRNRGDAWKYTLDQLSGFFGRALAAGTQAPRLRSGHPFALMNDELPGPERALLGEYLDAASLLGKRTAEMHQALASGSGVADFVPEPFGPSDAAKLYEDMLRQADIAFELLRRKQGTVKGSAQELAHSLLQKEHAVTERFAALRGLAVGVSRIRHHGDYHLGQVLRTDDDFMIIDFEGEPARPLPERRKKTIAMRDVAGMIRSFQYAAYAALFGEVPGVADNPELADTIEAWAAFWTARVSATYLKSYFDQAGHAVFMPNRDEDRHLLFDAFLLQKALYEVAYELNNRPEWVRIPMRGIVSLLS
jgi:maltose alpha-D-glucosyltransferase/alpha-amylase